MAVQNYTSLICSAKATRSSIKFTKSRVLTPAEKHDGASLMGPTKFAIQY